MNRRERRASPAKVKLQSVKPDGAALFYDAALRDVANGRHADAERCCHMALAIDGGHAPTLNLLGILALQGQQYGAALQWVSRALQQDVQPQYFLSLGTVLQVLGRSDEVLKVVDKATALGLESADLWMLRGNALINLQQLADAVSSFQRVLELNSRHWDAANQCGITLQRLGRIDDALTYLDLSDVLRPNHVPTLLMRGALLNGLKRFDEALTICQRAHAIEPENSDICVKTGIVLRTMCRDEDALDWFERALALQPGSRDALHDKASVLTKLRRFDEAFEIYRQLKGADPRDALADLGTAHLNLLLGNLDAGWSGREARWSLPSSYPRFRQPMWLGQDGIAGQTIVIAADEGLGDTIQFVRYVPMVVALGARVILAVQKPLLPLLSNMPGISQCIPVSEAADLAGVDAHCPIMSLPFVFRTTLATIPAPASYLPAPDPDRIQLWQERLGTPEKLRVGLVWSGNPNHLDDHNRSIPLRTLSRLLGADAAFVSLQKEPKAEDKAVLQETSGIVDLTGQLADFADTAALISCLDLVITVDTSVAHLAGALGCPTWTLLSYTPDYRWLLDRDDSVWYPRMRLFRQRERRDWGEVIDQVGDALHELVGARAPSPPVSSDAIA
ncbi:MULTISPECIES: tetratricopeptide repeat-containing glycosyltransferase family protein [unclassified Bradyrhizobium]|uniref:tetratricopeptide repeat-containing glycosyltransferase family protein n=1 Tax=unclassified Bradyrhizobium TaxID=2631580 RepID=UPI002916678D|nr:MULTISPECIES: tetratricopeptide repeat-containing glycosyltransferase family protein [unclassified Bradyrhizobium]